MTPGNYRELCYGFVNSAVSGSDEIKCSFTKTSYLRCSLMKSGTRKPDRVPIGRFLYFQRPVKNVWKIFLDFFPFFGSIFAAICRRSLASCSNSESKPLSKGEVRDLFYHHRRREPVHGLAAAKIKEPFAFTQTFVAPTST